MRNFHTRDAPGHLTRWHHSPSTRFVNRFMYARLFFRSELIDSTLHCPSQHGRCVDVPCLCVCHRLDRLGDRVNVSSHLFVSHLFVSHLFVSRLFVSNLLVSHLFVSLPVFINTCLYHTYLYHTSLYHTCLTHHLFVSLQVFINTCLYHTCLYNHLFVSH